MARHLRLLSVVFAAVLVMSLAPAAFAYPEAYDSAGRCTIRVRAYERLTKARHQMYDHTKGCGTMRMKGLRRCWGSNKIVDTSAGADAIVREYAGCDAISTEGWSSGAYAYSGP